MGGEGDLWRGRFMREFLVTMEAQVPPDQEERLLLAYDYAMRNRPPGVVQSMLTRDAHNRTTWRIHTIWESHEALEAHYKSSIESDAVMPSAHAFHLVGIEPTSVASEIIATDATVITPPQPQRNDQNDALT
jgi:quinol monooxygenase YgiN